MLASCRDGHVPCNPTRITNKTSAFEFFQKVDPNGEEANGSQVYVLRMGLILLPSSGGRKCV